MGIERCTHFHWEYRCTKDAGHSGEHRVLMDSGDTVLWGDPDANVGEIFSEYIVKNARLRLQVTQLKDAFRTAKAYALAALDDTDVISEEARGRWLADLQKLSKEVEDL